MRVPRRFVVVLLAGVAVSSRILAAQTPAPTIEIAAEDAADLWSRPDGRGFANEVVRAAFHAAGAEVNFRVVPYARCKHLVIAGSVVACFSMSRDPALNGSVIFPSVPIFTCYADLVENPAHPVRRVAQLSELPRGTIVGTVLGYEYPAAVQQAVKSGAVVLDEAPTEEMLLRKLAAGRLPLAILNVNESKSLAYVSALAHLAAPPVPVNRVGTLESYLGFSAKHPGAKQAMHLYEDGMRKIAGNGVLAAITRRWTDSSLAIVRAEQHASARPQ
jgi:polar amino acid transport system substrate-binding protein